ncbi:MAG: hypothetical protein AAGF53_17010, partial [Pseudomonadota bacterium]
MFHKRERIQNTDGSKVRIADTGLAWLNFDQSVESGGETGIRTLETVSRLHAFQACAFDHSAT